MHSSFENVFCSSGSKLPNRTLSLRTKRKRSLVELISNGSPEEKDFTKHMKYDIDVDLDVDVDLPPLHTGLTQELDILNIASSFDASPETRKNDVSPLKSVLRRR